MVKIHPSLCTECRICMQICSWTHFQEQTSKRARLSIVAEWPQTPDIHVCQACPDHDCIEACPNHALRWEGWVLLDEALCDGCGMCLAACPVGGVHMDPRTELPLICDTCQGEYQCVSWCPTQALQREET